MPRYMLTGTYNADGMKGLLKEGGTARRDACAKLCANSEATSRRSTSP